MNLPETVDPSSSRPKSSLPECSGPPRSLTCSGRALPPLAIAHPEPDATFATHGSATATTSRPLTHPLTPGSNGIRGILCKSGVARRAAHGTHGVESPGLPWMTVETSRNYSPRFASLLRPLFDGELKDPQNHSARLEAALWYVTSNNISILKESTLRFPRTRHNSVSYIIQNRTLEVGSSILLGSTK